MEAGNSKNKCEVCGSGYGQCGNCGNMCGFGSWHVLRWILGIIIITWVFSIGMRIGQITCGMESGYYGRGYGRVMPMMYGGYDSQDFQGRNMMYGTVQTDSAGAKGGTVQTIKGN